MFYILFVMRVQMYFYTVVIPSCVGVISDINTNHTVSNVLRYYVDAFDVFLALITQETAI